MPTTKTQEDQSVNTGLKLRGFEVWAVTPGHYRHYHTLFLRLPETFPTRIDCVEFCGAPYYQIAFDRPDGYKQVVYSGWRTEEEAQRAYETYSGAKQGTVGCQFEVGYKLTDENGDYLPYSFAKATEPTAKPWGTTWARPWDGTGKGFDYAPLAFDLTQDEAAVVIAWREKADAEWFAARPDFLPREERITEAQVAGLSETAAEFVVDAMDAGLDVAVLPSRELPTATECLECGATYDEPGHVEPGGMACDRCA